MNTLQISFKKLHPNAVTPSKAHPDDAGFDLTATEVERTAAHSIYKTGIAVSIPPGFVGLLFPRSSIRKYDLTLANSVGVVDSGFVGEVCLTFRRANIIPAVYDIGDRIGQLVIVPIPSVQMVEVDDLGSTERGVNGHGSTGR